jgi:hypothetical protein
MRTLLLLITLLSIVIVGQNNSVPTDEEKAKAYGQVIVEYIKSQSETKELNFDTLYIGNHEEFPDIKLPAAIQNKKIILLTYTKGDTTPQNQKSFILINIIEMEMTKDRAAFMIVTFHQGYHPQHNCYVDLNYNSATKEFELEKKIRYEYVYGKGK